MFYVITNISKQKTEGPNLMDLFPDFIATAQNRGKIVSLAHWPPLPQEILLVLISCTA